MTTNIPTIVTRVEIPVLTSVTQGALEFDLGELRDFRHSDLIAEHLPNNLSISWVKLDAERRLEPHTHPMQSIVIICSGKGKLIGCREQGIGKGDTVIIPPGALHGFVGGLPSGFEGLSIQFENSGIYTDMENLKVKFSESIMDWGMLIDCSEKQASTFASHSVFDTIKFATLTGKNIFVSHFIEWSQGFQKAMLARSAAATREPFRSIFFEHLAEEYGHDRELISLTAGKLPIRNDPIISGICSWFIWNLVNCDDFGRWVISHMVIEKSADVFYSNLSGVDFGSAQQHFNTHEECDEAHALFGMRRIREAGFVPTKVHVDLIEEGWEMIFALFSRLSDLSLSSEVTDK